VVDQKQKGVLILSMGRVGANRLRYIANATSAIGQNEEWIKRFVADVAAKGLPAEAFETPPPSASVINAVSELFCLKLPISRYGWHY